MGLFQAAFLNFATNTVYCSYKAVTPRLTPNMIHVTLSAVTKKILLQQQQQFRCMGHTVRIICKQDLPNGKAYAGDVVRVRAGFARNYLIPQKIAMYATPQNFVLLNMKDPEMETPEERTARMQQEAIVGQDADLRASDLLTKYLKDKVVSKFIIGLEVFLIGR
jgi:hypothetical protein